MIATALERLATDGPEAPYDVGHLSFAISELLEGLEPTNGLQDGDIARLEWIYLDLLGHSNFQAKHLYRGMATDPEFFMEILRYAYKARKEESDETSPTDTEAEEAAGDDQGNGADERLAGRAFRLLFNWRTPPGVTDEGTIDEDALREWVHQARELAYEEGRGQIADQMIGEVFVHLPVGADGVSPPEVVRDLFEEIGSRNLEQGFSIGVLNSRGFTSRSPDEGGGQERSLVAKFRESAEAVVAWPRTASLLRSLAEAYEQDAVREDRRSELYDEGILD